MAAPRFTTEPDHDVLAGKCDIELSRSAQAESLMRPG
jgi:hypothetical protein